MGNCQNQEYTESDAIHIVSRIIMKQREKLDIDDINEDNKLFSFITDIEMQKELENLRITLGDEIE